MNPWLKNSGGYLLVYGWSSPCRLHRAISISLEDRMRPFLLLSNVQTSLGIKRGSNSSICNANCSTNWLNVDSLRSSKDRCRYSFWKSGCIDLSKVDYLALGQVIHRRWVWYSIGHCNQSWKEVGKMHVWRFSVYLLFDLVENG